MSVGNRQRRCERERKREGERQREWRLGKKSDGMEECELLLEGSGVGEEVSRVRPLWCFVEAAQF
jgi:hypothetical protein